MKIFQNFTIEINKNEQINFVNNIKDNKIWIRDLKKEGEFKGPSEYFIFTKENDIECDPCTLFIYRYDDVLKVINIIPKNKNKMSHDEYNNCLNSFICFISMYIKNHNTETTNSEFSLLDYLTPESARALEFFSHTANKTTGSAHPCDKERWQLFIIQSHIDNKTLSTDYLERWLIEDEGWHHDVASDLVIEYEQALSLLSSYDRYK